MVPRASPSGSGGADRTDRQQAATAHLPLVRYIARRFMALGHDPEEIIQVGTIGLIKALDRFDPSRGAFSTYACALILGEIQRYLRDQVPGPAMDRGSRELVQRARREAAHMAASLGREPTVPELAAQLGVDAGELAAAMEAASRPLSLDEPLGGEEGRETRGEMLPAATSGVWERLLLRDLLRRLPARHARVIALRYFLDRTQVEVARLLGISQAHVSRLEQQAIRQLRQWMV